MKVGGASIPKAMAVWDADGTTLIYGEARYSVHDLAQEITTTPPEARRAFHDELCFGFADVPEFPLAP
ncbi:hypothetical protein LTR41_011695 [Exophiala xenobiotica]|nr:hypothetical protein LTR41_011695 [Exophiala xenobiotica]KAK5243283.1 hypothetical protein LTS06_010919 [Exophiala xenobiotica]KAK5280522.1 hypothetical protein LTR40_006232 [Exophiala xenobiotica]